MAQGDGSFSYDYQAMWDAYDDMMDANKKITGGAEDMQREATRVLQAASGSTRDGYHQRFKDLQTILTDLNDMLGSKANTMQELFSNMERLDGKLGDGF